MDAGAGSCGTTTFLSGGLPPQYGSGLDPAGLEPAGLDPAGFPPKHADAIIPAASAAESIVRLRVLGILDMTCHSLEVNVEGFISRQRRGRRGPTSLRDAPPKSPRLTEEGRNQS